MVTALKNCMLTAGYKTFDFGDDVGTVCGPRLEYSAGVCVECAEFV